MQEEISDRVKKNLLDLQYNKYLLYYNTSIILLFTYFIGVTIAFITKQISYKNINQLLLVTAISITVISFIISFMLRFKEHLTNILQEVKKLKL